MTDPAEPGKGPQRKRRRKKKRPPTEPTAPKAALEAKTEHDFPTAALAYLVIAVAAAGYYLQAEPNAPPRQYALVALGFFAFLSGASRSVDPERIVGLTAVVVALGLAILGIRPSEVGTVLAMGGGLALGGGIHRLGRLGPDTGALELPAPTNRVTSD